MLLPGDTAQHTVHRNQHLGPRVLAAELAALVADPESALHQVCKHISILVHNSTLFWCFFGARIYSGILR